MVSQIGMGLVRETLRAALDSIRFGRSSFCVEAPCY